MVLKKILWTKRQSIVSLIDKLTFWCFLGIAITYPLAINLNSIFIILVVGLSLLKYYMTKELSFTKLHGAFILFFLSRFVSLLYTDDIESGIKIMMRSMSLVAFPIIMMMQKKALPSKVKFTKFLFWSTTFACLYCLYHNFSFFMDRDIPFKLWMDWKYNHYHLSRYLEFGPNYFSLLIIFNLIGVYFFRKKLSIWYFLGSLIQVIFMILLSSRGMLGFLFLTLIIIALYKAYKMFKLFGVVCSLILSVLLFYGVYSSVPVFRQRFVKTYKELVSNDMEQNQVGGIVTRKQKFKASMQIIENNIFFGVGIGDVRNQLTVQFKRNNFVEGVNKWYDAHNQYLESFMASGIIGILCFLLIFILWFTKGIERKDYYLLIILALFTFYGLLESYIETHKGIVLFSLVFTYYFFKEEEIKKDNLITIDGQTN